MILSCSIKEKTDMINCSKEQSDIYLRKGWLSGGVLRSDSQV